MKKKILFLLSTLSVTCILAQAPQIDSLNKLLTTTKEDTVKVMVLVNLSFFDQSFQHGLDLAKEGLAIARKIKFEKGETACLNQIGNQYLFTSNYPMALQYYLDALKINERLNNANDIADSYGYVGMVYQEQGDYRKAIDYIGKVLSLQPSSNNSPHYNQRLGLLYSGLGKQDSALIYYQRSYENFILSNDKYRFNLTLNGLGDIQLNMGNNELALGYYRQAIKNGNLYNDTTGLSYSFLKIAAFYDVAGQQDSSIVYAEKSMSYAQRAYALKNVIASGKLLSKLYENNNTKEALRNLQISQAATDSFFDKEKSIQLQNMLFNQMERERELAHKERKSAEERKKNIQYVLIALSIITLLIIYLLLSRSFITNTRLINFFGVIALLIVFEFLNLLLHPFLERVTNHSPVLILLALVCIAALLVPLHHKVEKWATAKLVEKNKQIRLAAARKTIQKLDKKTEKS